MLELAGATVPEAMDGRSFAAEIGYGHRQRHMHPPREDLLIEYWAAGNATYGVHPGVSEWVTEWVG